MRKTVIIDTNILFRGLRVDIDEEDTPFLALTLELKGELWTNDEALKIGLRKKGFFRFFEG